MPNISPRILVSAIAGLVMVGGAFWLSTNKAQPESTVFSVTSQTSAPIRTFIKVEDKNNDSIPDWQESFVLSTVDLDQPNNGTNYTENIARGLAEATLANKSNTDQGSDEILKSTSAGLSSIITDDSYTKEDINISKDDSLAAWKKYGNDVAEIALNNSVPKGSESELSILSTSMTANNPDNIKKLDPIITAYANMRDQMINVPVPPSLIKEHLSLINVYQAIYADISAWRQVFEDTLPAMLRLRRYETDATALYTAVSNLYLKLDKSGIKWNDTDTASHFIKIQSS